MTIGERIKHIRMQEGMAQTELAKATKISKQNIYKYENNIITNIPSDKIESIARALNTTPAYLMGWETEADSSFDMEIAKNIKALRIKAGMTQAQFGAIAGVSDKAISTWENGTAVPRMGAIEKIAKYFGIKKSDLIEDTSSDDDLLELLRNNKNRATIIGFGDGRHIKTDMTYEDFEELEAMWRALKEKRKQGK